MTINDIINKKVDIFGSGKTSSKVMYTTTLKYFLTKLTVKNKDKVEKVREINKTDKEAAKKYKASNLIGCTISATFNEYRLIEKAKELNGLIAIDIDKDKNEGLDPEKAKNDVMKLKYVAMSMLSCRGEGIWCLVPYNKNNDFKETWLALKEDFLEIGYTIDSCKDITRLRFISYDDNILVRQGEIEEYDKTKHIEAVENREYNGLEWELTKDNMRDIAMSIYILTNYCGYSSDDYYEWLLDGFRLATIPNKALGLKLFTMISENSSNFKSYKDVEYKFNECCRTTKYNTSILGYYINKVRELYGLEWKQKANQIIRQH